MKKQITKGKVIQNCLKVTAAVVVAGGVGFQFHEIQELNKDLNTLEKSHNRTVLELKTASETNKALEQENDQITAVTEKLSTDLDELKKSKEALKKSKEAVDRENKKLQNQNDELARQLRKAKEYPRQLKSGSTSGNSASTKTSTVTPTKTSVNTNTSNKVVYGVGTAYTASCKGCTGTTASGHKVRSGMVAMASWVPLGTRVRITCDSYPSINGVYTVSDRGGAIKGNKVDIFMASHSDAVQFGKRDIKIEILN